MPLLRGNNKLFILDLPIQNKKLESCLCVFAGLWSPQAEDCVCLAASFHTDLASSLCAHEVTYGPTGPSSPPFVHPFPSPLFPPPLNPLNHGPEDLWQHQVSGCTWGAFVSASPS